MQLSAKKLSRQKEADIVNHFVTLLSDINNPQHMGLFLQSFLSKTELMAFAKRLDIAWMLSQQKSYDEIARTLNVSSATISTVANSLDSEGMKLAFKKIKVDQWTNTLSKWLKIT